MNDEKIKEMVQKVVAWVNKNKVMTVLILLFTLTLSSCATQDKDEVVNNDSETQVEQQEVEDEEEYIEEDKSVEEENIEEDKSVEEENIEEDKSVEEENDKAKDIHGAYNYINDRLSTLDMDYDVEIDDSGVIMVTLDIDKNKILNSSLSAWNELGNITLKLSNKLKGELNNNGYTDIHISIAIGDISEDSIYFATFDDRVILDVPNGISPKLQDDGSYDL